MTTSAVRYAGSSPATVAARVRDRASALSAYLDASAFVKLFLPEPESESLNAGLRGHRQLIVSDWTVTEAVSAIARRMREDAIDAAVAADLYRRMMLSVDGGYFLRAGSSRTIHREAERLLMALQADALRAGDALHLALALSVDAEAIVTFDLRLGRAAPRLGLQVVP